ncbi:hypothetical protein LTR53_014328 [Teratosphaeriaceae sp. CCFEE 6253]|nr:hypothetical protein LTR53_014328 [Teratosphaeriaceae sp. CCFEE 6253]
MVAVSKIAALLAATMVSASFNFDIVFHAYAKVECGQPSKRTVHMQDNLCYALFHHDPLKSYSFVARGPSNDNNRKGCRVAVYSDDRCSGNATSQGDAKKHFDQCGEFHPEDADLGFHSVGVTCGEHTAEFQPKKYEKAKAKFEKSEAKKGRPVQADSSDSTSITQAGLHGVPTGIPAED